MTDTTRNPIDISPFLGHWYNTADAPKWLDHFEVFQREHHWYMRCHALGDGDLGECQLTTYRDNMGGLAFFGDYALGHRVVSLAVNTQIELIVVTAFHRHKPEEMSENRVQREFFYRETNH